ncbi:MAG: sulfotransferase family 2 domain-containing protein [Pseudomonadales bacterium]
MPFFESAQQKILFVHIPKTGGTSIEVWLDNLLPMGFYQNGIPDVLRCSPQHLTMHDIRSIFWKVKWDYAFSIVRNPYTRMESEYFYRTSTAEVTFSDWLLKNLENYLGDNYIFDNHFRPQNEFLGYGLEVFRLEDGLGQVVSKLTDITGLIAPPSEPRINAAHRRSLLWSSEARQLFNQIYTEDFSLLSYDRIEP